MEDRISLLRPLVSPQWHVGSRTRQIQRVADSGIRSASVVSGWSAHPGRSQTMLLDRLALALSTQSQLEHRHRKAPIVHQRICPDMGTIEGPVRLTRNAPYHIIAIMTKVKTRIKTRNWVAKNDHNRSSRHRSVRDYQRQPKHRKQDETQ